MNPALKRLLVAVFHYLIFFVMVAFVITCCMTLFLSTFSAQLGFSFTEENLTIAAKLTFWNVALLSLIFCISDALRRRFTVERPVRRITEAAERMMQGDFSVRIPLQKNVMTGDRFNEIIECFNQMAKELSSVETLRTDFVANVSHEMKTPLAVMQNYGKLLQSPDLSEQKRLEYADGICRAAKRLADMMTDILRLSRLENQQIYPEKSTFDLGEQLCECLLAFENVWEERGIDIQTDIAQDITVNADAQLLSLVWNNLLSNAFKFTETGGKVSLQLTATEHHASVSVKDTGCGMSPEVGAHIFEKFYQGDTSRAMQGNGLGLALVKRVVDILGGEISVQSVPDKGSTFTVKIRRN